jgi:3-hydroxyisobutyrate dehydrogenase-like beta-hydroxyacid dehydrogenase
VASRAIGLIGLGLLGSALAERLLASGHSVVGFDIDADRRANLERLGGEAADSSITIARQCSRIVLSLPTSDTVDQLLSEIENDLAPESIIPESIIIDTTTGDPGQIAAFGPRLAGRGVEYLDATVGGSSQQVRAADALVLVGGTAQAFEACQELFSSFSKRAFHVGPGGSGARMKLVFNLVLGLNRAVLAEGLSFAEASGIDAAQALEVLQAGAAYSTVMDTKGRKMIDQDFSAQARLSQHLKDVRLILASGERSGAWLPLSQLHRSLLEEVEAAGFGEADNSAIIKAFDPER